ncbi:hypothetical protein FVE85_9794 [Porphyridium purpureum]|uniref:Uncharacterized protein n=1 Tax=Porphyridium purpureum TaxID=35688 RepID=A0A5J4YIF5_PORPP|nr:hypothetical protein FVE85_9794 [Porphyridium purpureum]|eukprot:POR8231..scf273_44
MRMPDPWLRIMYPPLRMAYPLQRYLQSYISAIQASFHIQSISFSAQLLGAPLDASGTSESLVPLHALAAHVVALAERVARLPNLSWRSTCSGSVGPRRLAYLARVMPPGVMDALFRTFDHQWRTGWTRGAAFTSGVTVPVSMPSGGYQRPFGVLASRPG